MYIHMDVVFRLYTFYYKEVNKSGNFLVSVGQQVSFHVEWNLQIVYKFLLCIIHYIQSSQLWSLINIFFFKLCHNIYILSSVNLFVFLYSYFFIDCCIFQLLSVIIFLLIHSTKLTAFVYFSSMTLFTTDSVQIWGWNISWNTPNLVFVENVFLTHIFREATVYSFQYVTYSVFTFMLLSWSFWYNRFCICWQILYLFVSIL